MFDPLLGEPLEQAINFGPNIFRGGPEKSFLGSIFREAFGDALKMDKHVESIQK